MNLSIQLVDLRRAMGRKDVEDEKDVAFELEEDGEGIADRKPGLELGEEPGAEAADVEADQHQRLRRSKEDDIPKESLGDRIRKARKGR
jgi:hypothetical protein